MPSARKLSGAFTFLLAAASAFAAPTRPQLKVTAYNIQADLDPKAGKLTAAAIVTFTALEDLTTPTFELNNGLTITSITDNKNKPLTSERLTPQNAIRVTLANPIPKGTSVTWTFDYTGSPTVETSPVEGIKLVAVADPISILLYPGRWFPMSQTGLYTDRFTAEMHITVPSDERVVGSGATGTPKSVGGTKTEYAFNWTKPGFPGTIVAGKFIAPQHVSNFNLYTLAEHKSGALEFGALASKEFEFMSSTFGQPETTQMNIVELPQDTVSASWGPGLAAIAGNRIVDHTATRLLANTLAHQWFGSEISPATLNDAWITNGMSRYAELLYLEDSAGRSSFQTAVGDISAGALAYDTEPLSTMGRLDPFSPQFQSMTLEKGAMIFHMLRWELGNEAFDGMLRSLLSEYTDKSVRTRDVQDAALAVGHDMADLGPFFAQWIDGTGAPQFTDKYTVYRLGNNKGFRTVGAISQDLDLFRMPVELRIETEGKTEVRRVDVTGTDSSYSVETFGRPRRITIDPQAWVLKSTPDLAVKVAVLRGQQLVGQGDLTGALVEYQKALDANKNSSLAAYRIGEIFFQQHNYQSAANSFRDALRGDGDPKWTEVWSHIELGRIFDVTGQRERAVNEYRQAVQTNDNTQGAVNEARNSLTHPYTVAKAD